MTRFAPLRSQPTPVQARAQKRVEVILEAAEALLADHAPGEITPSLIAAQGGIPVSSIYRYFPGAQEVLRELYLQAALVLRDQVMERLADTARMPSWRDRLHHILTAQHRYMARHQYYTRLLVHFQAQRGPDAAADEEHDLLLQALTARWSAGGDGFHTGDPEVVAHCVVQVVLSMEDLIATTRDEARAAALADELFALLEGYLARYLRD